VAVQLILAGVLLMGVPVIFGDSVIAAGCRTLSPLAWLMAVAGAVLLLFLPGKRADSSSPTTSVPLRMAPLQPEATQPCPQGPHPSQQATDDR